MIYKGDKTKEISFPLGGIGAGCIGLAGNGRLIDWEIFNKPNKGGYNGMSHFAIKAETKDEQRVVDARILNGDLQDSLTGNRYGNQFEGYGFGTSRNNLTGVPHFRDTEFNGEFPVAELSFLDESFPGKIVMTAFNPFIPLNDRDSSISAAFFSTTVTNTTDKPLVYTMCMSLNNPLPLNGAFHRYKQNNGFHSVTLTNEKLKPHETSYGDLTVATDATDVSYQEYWYRGGWYDNLGVFWKDFNKAGRFVNRSYPRIEGEARHNADLCSLAAHFELAPGDSKSIRFVVSWSFPNAYVYWKDNSSACGPDCDCNQPKQTWRNYYASLFKDSSESAAYALSNWDRLYRETLLFKDALFSSTMPDSAIDAVSANISILKSPTCLRLEDGSFYGWEGCSCGSGCCEGSCTHVWNYAYALPFLFPSLERSMRDLNYTYNQREDGGMCFRLPMPLGSEIQWFRACVDGQYGDVIKTYRDWKICGDTEWLRNKWLKIKKSIDYAWSEDNADQWDRDMDGVLEGRQHHTLDMELFGPGSWLNGMYLAALKAGYEMAEALGDNESAVLYRKIFESGKQFVENELFNGEYFIQKIDLNDKALLERYSEGDTWMGTTAVQAYWNDEAEEIKYQMGEGCAIDQVLAQWHANISDLGDIFDRDKTRSALRSIMRYNYKDSVRNVFNPCRIYAQNDEAGTLICEWPKERYKPVTPAPYCEETWPGLEYQVGSHMIQEGMVEEGTRVITAVRDRFDGRTRNPWNEFECGSNYARSMSSYALLNAYSGFSFDMTKGMIGFEPKNNDADCRFFFSLDSGWGVFSRQKNSSQESGLFKIEILYGSLTLSCVKLNVNATEVELGGVSICYRNDNNTLIFAENIELVPGRALCVK